MSTVAERACRHLHALEWEALAPRKVPCGQCVELADSLTSTPPVPPPFYPWCPDCGPGYRLGEEGCRHGDYAPEIGETGVCRTCAQTIWWEPGEIGHREVTGWSDRIMRGGDSVVCFKAADYRHVPMGGREAAIYRAGVKAGREIEELSGR